MITFAVIPLGRPHHLGHIAHRAGLSTFIGDINVGILYVLAISSLAVYGIVLAGWSSGNHYSLLGALRSAAQMVSYEVSIGLSLVGVLMFAGTLNMVDIVHAQVHQGIWFILAQPLGFILFGIAAIAEVNRAPFDLPEAEQELVAGYLTEFSGLRWSLFQMAEYINMITTSSVLATLFLGGWTLGALSGVRGAPFIWFGVKVAFFLFIFIWLRATLPRIRYDQLMRFGWQVLLPLSVLNALMTAVVVAFDLPWWVSGLIGLAILLIASAIYYLRLRSNRRTNVPFMPATAGLDQLMPASVRMVDIDPTRPPVMPTSAPEPADTVATP